MSTLFFFSQYLLVFVSLFFVYTYGNFQYFLLFILFVHTFFCIFTYKLTYNLSPVLSVHFLPGQSYLRTGSGFGRGFAGPYEVSRHSRLSIVILSGRYSPQHFHLLRLRLQDARTGENLCSLVLTFFLSLPQN